MMTRLLTSIATLFLTISGLAQSSSPLTAMSIKQQPLKHAEVTTVFEEPGVIKVIHGSACGESNKPGKEDIIELSGEYDLPDYANEATVVLNGWRLKYLSSDHHVRGISASIQTLDKSPGLLTWKAHGVLTDRNFDDGYTFCYYYTALAWNDAAIHAHTFNSANEHNKDYYLKNHTALTVLPSYYHMEKFQNVPKVHIPRGFSLFFGNDYRLFPACFDCPTDHHILQFGFNSNPAEAFIDPKKAYGFLPQPMLPSTDQYADMGYLSWNTYGIIKDDSRRRDSWVDEWFSVVAGQDAHVIMPPYHILPHEESGGFNSACLGEGPGEKTKQVVIRHIPYDFAIPMLSGFEMKYACGDEHVTEVGVWIESIQYTKPAGQNGTLSYIVSTQLKDKNSSPGHLSTHNVHVLGLNGDRRRPNPG